MANIAKDSLYGSFAFRVGRNHLQNIVYVGLILAKFNFPVIR